MLKLKELGWIDGQTLSLQWASAADREGRLPEMAAELVRRRPDVIWAIGPEAAIAAARATRTVPVVFWGASFPVETGLVDSIVRPGRNVVRMRPGRHAKAFELDVGGGHQRGRRRGEQPSEHEAHRRPPHTG